MFSLQASDVIDKPNNRGSTPLHLACAAGNRRMVQALLAAGAGQPSPNNTLAGVPGHGV